MHRMVALYLCPKNRITFEIREEIKRSSLIDFCFRFGVLTRVLLRTSSSEWNSEKQGVAVRWNIRRGPAKIGQELNIVAPDESDMSKLSVSARGRGGGGLDVISSLYIGSPAAHV